MVLRWRSDPCASLQQRRRTSKGASIDEAVSRFTNGFSRCVPSCCGWSSQSKMNFYAWSGFSNLPFQGKSAFSWERLTNAMSISTFCISEMLPIRIHAKGSGRPPKLSLEESMALCLFYLRPNPTFEVLGMIFEVSRSEAHVAFHWRSNWIRKVPPASLYEEFGHVPELWSLIQEILRS